MDLKQKIAQANQEVTRRLAAGEPVLVDVAPAAEVIPALQGRTITHAGPPIEWQHMCGAQQGAVIGMVLYEGWAGDPAAARAVLAREGGAPALREALRHIGGLDLSPIISQALQMGDELHNRHSASSSLFANRMGVAMCAGRDSEGASAPDDAKP